MSNGTIDTKINLCDTCKKYNDYPYCTDYPNGKDEIVFGNGVGNDNVCKCSKYELIEGNN